MRTIWHPPGEEINLAGVMHALSDPVRLRILADIADEDWHVCGSLVLGVQKSTISHHMRVLREAGVTETRLEGRNRYIRLRRSDLENRFPGLLDPLLRAAAEPD